MDKAYRPPMPANLAQLRHRITAAVQEVRLDMLQRVWQINLLSCSSKSFIACVLNAVKNKVWYKEVRQLSFKREVVVLGEVEGAKREKRSSGRLMKRWSEDPQPSAWMTPSSFCSFKPETSACVLQGRIYPNSALIYINFMEQIFIVYLLEQKSRDDAISYVMLVSSKCSCVHEPRNESFHLSNWYSTHKLTTHTGFAPVLLYNKESRFFNLEVETDYTLQIHSRFLEPRKLGLILRVGLIFFFGEHQFRTGSSKTNTFLMKMGDIDQCLLKMMNWLDFLEVGGCFLLLCQRAQQM
ncbi:hypothetical protein C0J52_15691 [Blattella germanica]|nr:hypothetical protein C0J52_15691 [Blattella germanica]